MIGVKGAGLSALALILKDLGNTVVGYDDEKKYQFTEDKLIDAGIKIYSDNSFNLTSDMIVIRSTAVKFDHPEILKANAKKIKIYEYNEFLGELTKEFQTVAVSGCHGKTTTTSMLKTVVDKILGCNYLVGDGSGYADKENRLFLIEACEYRRNFLAYNPSISVITNIDLDHVDYFKDIDDVKEAYQDFANKTKDLVVIYGDDANSRSLKIDTETLYYGLEAYNDVVASNVVYDENGINFSVDIKEEHLGHFSLPFYGRHLLLNTLAVIAVADYLGIKPELIQERLAEFKGANRRFNEVIINDNVVVDDYAHHPSEIRATIEAARQKYPDKDIVVVFEPHTFSRTKEFAKEIAEALNQADEVHVTEIFKSREKKENFPDVTSEIIIKELYNGKFLERNIEPLENYTNSVMLFMSPKDIDDIRLALIERLKDF